MVLDLFVYYDNQDAAYIASSLVYDESAYRDGLSFNQGEITNGLIRTPFFKSTELLTDIFTKFSPHNLMFNILNKLGMIDIYALA